MDISDHIASFDTRWEIKGGNNKEKYSNFLTSAKISFNSLTDGWDRYDNRAFYNEFCRLGHYSFFVTTTYINTELYLESIIYFIVDKDIDKISNISEILKKFQIFLWLLKKRDKKAITKLLNQDLRNAKLNIKIVEIDGEFEFIRTGAKELDETFVDSMLVWLDNYPNTRNHYSNSLKLYMQAELNTSKESIRSTLDELRFTLEQFLKEFHEVPMNTGWEKLFNATTKYLKAQSVAPQIRSVYTTILNYYDAYQNSNVKHTFGAKANEIEFILYQTGSLIRFLIQLKREEEAETA